MWFSLLSICSHRERGARKYDNNKMQTVLTGEQICGAENEAFSPRHEMKETEEVGKGRGKDTD